MTDSDNPAATAPVRADGVPLLALHGISKRFGAVQALARIEIEISPGEVTALVGDNGAGKSVTIKTISGLWHPDDGEILWEGKPVEDIVQNMFLGHELLKHGLLDEAAMESTARERLSDLRVTTVRSIRQPVASLSGGQRQSVAVAKAVLQKAKLVIMDEPTAALGVAQTGMVLGLIKRLSEEGVAVMVVSHNLNDVFAVADRIVILQLGRTVAAGPISDFDPSMVVDYMTTGRSDRTPSRTVTAAARTSERSG
jgi:ABC-type sugar transport system ATPase subunit